jgi:TrmH family RNA methyltransferase
MSQITRKDNPGALVAAFKQKHLTLDGLDKTGSGIWIALYEVRDPGNLGTILRTADCAGLAGVILLETCCDPYSVEAVRASMGSVFDIRFASSDFHSFDRWRKAQGLTMIAASVNGTHRHDAVPYGNRAIIIMGNEQAGLPAPVEATCDHLCLIPMRGGADSLNLAQATAIMSYEAWRQQGYPGAREG